MLKIVTVTLGLSLLALSPSCGPSDQGYAEDGDVPTETDGDDAVDGDSNPNTDGDQEDTDTGCESGMPCLGFPAEVNLGAVPFGQSAERNLILSNPGSEVVRVYGYELCPGAPCPAFAVEPDTVVSEDSPLELQPGEQASWLVRFTRLDAADAQGELRLQSDHRNGQQTPKVSLISSEKGSAVFRVDPSSIAFPQTSVQLKSWVDVSLVNTPGDSESSRTIQLVSLETVAPFYLDPEDPSCFGTLQGADRYLGSGTTRTCRVFFQPGAGGSFRGELTVTFKGEGG